MYESFTYLLQTNYDHVQLGNSRFPEKWTSCFLEGGLAFMHYMNVAEE